MHGVGCPVVGVIGDAGFFVGGYSLAFHHPFNGGFSVYDVVVGGFGDVFHGNFAVVDDFGFIVFFGKFHFDHTEIFICAADDLLRGKFQTFQAA